MKTLIYIPRKHSLSVYCLLSMTLAVLLAFHIYSKQEYVKSGYNY